MTKRCPSAESLGVGVLRDHELTFPRKGDYRPGGVASVEAAEGRRVYGVIWQINAEDAEKLDEVEGRTSYERVDLPVVDYKGNTYDTYTYQAIPEGTYKPSADYLKTMISGAEAAGLPADYIDELHQIETLEGD